MIKFIRNSGTALLLAALAFPAAATERHREKTEGREKSEVRDRVERILARRELERELRQARRAFQAAARRVQELQARLMAEEAEARALREEAIRSTIRIRHRARLGVVVDPSRPAPEDGSGAVIVAVTPGSPAEASGLQPGDVITGINGQDLAGGKHDHSRENPAAKLVRKARELRPGDEVSLTIRRQGASREVTLQAEEADWRPRWVTRQVEMPSIGTEYWPWALLEYESPDDETLEKWMDFELVALSPELGKYFGSEKGVLVIGAPENPPLDVKVGDVIVNIAGETLTTPLAAVRTLRSFEPGRKVDVRILRDRNEYTVQAVVPPLRSPHPRPPEKKDD